MHTEIERLDYMWIGHSDAVGPVLIFLQSRSIRAIHSRDSSTSSPHLLVMLLVNGDLSVIVTDLAASHGLVATSAPLPSDRTRPQLLRTTVEADIVSNCREVIPDSLKPTVSIIKTTP